MRYIEYGGEIRESLGVSGEITPRVAKSFLQIRSTPQYASRNCSQPLSGKSKAL